MKQEMVKASTVPPQDKKVIEVNKVAQETHLLKPGSNVQSINVHTSATQSLRTDPESATIDHEEDKMTK